MRLVMITIACFLLPVLVATKTPLVAEHSDHHEDCPNEVKELNVASSGKEGVHVEDQDTVSAAIWEKKKMMMKLIGGRTMGGKYPIRKEQVLKGKTKVLLTRKSSFAHDHEDGHAGFVAFSSDYPRPRHHPPKNN